MGKLIISEKILGTNMTVVAMKKAEEFCKEKNLSFSKISKELSSQTELESFLVSYHKYFGDEIKIII